MGKILSQGNLMQRPRPGEIWRFTKHTSISKHFVSPGTLIFVLETDDEFCEDNPKVLHLKAIIDNEVFDFYAPSSYMESCSEEFSHFAETG